VEAYILTASPISCIICASLLSLILKMAFYESDCSVLLESRDDFQSDLDHKYDTCLDDYFTDHNSVGDGDNGDDEPHKSHQVCVAAVLCFNVHMSQSCV
jgi:hypothetical protein